MTMGASNAGTWVGRVQPRANPIAGKAVARSLATPPAERAPSRKGPRTSRPRGPPKQRAGDVARSLAQHAERVCRHYLSNGRRRGAYWQVGDIANTPGQSLYVHLSGLRAGKWCDAATAEHGDLLDLIAARCNLPTLRDAIAEAQQFLDLPAAPTPARAEPRTSDKTRAAQRLFGLGRPITGTPVETYFEHRGITRVGSCAALRFHPRCSYRDGALQDMLPALLAAITDLDGRMTGIQRTWLDASGRGKAPVATPRRTLGRQLGNGVRFGGKGEVLLAGEGIETVLSLKSILPGMPMVAALSASNLGALVLPQGLKRLYVARDQDAAGSSAFERLARRAQGLGILVCPLDPVGDDFNDDLIFFGVRALRAALEWQMAAEDIACTQGICNGARPNG